LKAETSLFSIGTTGTTKCSTKP